MPPKVPKVPKLDAPIDEHRKHAREFLDLDEFKHKPPGHPDDKHETDTPVNP
jgi:hypothetical protein